MTFHSPAIAEQHCRARHDPAYLASQMHALEVKADICVRSAAVLDRALPAARAAHGFYDPDGFVEECKRRSERAWLFTARVNRLCDRARAQGLL